MTRHEVHFDTTRGLVEARANGHNRFHPEVAPLLRVAPGDVVSLDVRDGFDAQITPTSTADDVLRLDLERGHAMTGPIAIADAQPGDLLEVEILEIDTAQFGYTAVMPGIGLLGHRFARPFLVKWELAGGVARSADLPGVAIPGRPFLGVVAVAPSQEFVDRATARERALSPAHFVLLPSPVRAVPASAAAGLRTLAPRENGGNIDIRHLTAGSRVALTVQVPEALCSIGDPHFAQGDGESSGLAIETAARVVVRFGLNKEPAWRPRYPVVEFDGRIATTGIPVDGDECNHYLDVYAAAQAAAGEMLAYLCAERGLSEEQAYVLISVAVDLQISELVDAPNALVSAVLPLGVFE